MSGSGYLSKAPQKRNHPRKILTDADYWLRAMLEENSELKRKDKGSGDLVHQQMVNATARRST